MLAFAMTASRFGTAKENAEKLFHGNTFKFSRKFNSNSRHCFRHSQQQKIIVGR